MIKLMCKIIWYISETLNIPLGQYAPFIFGKMIGAKKMQKAGKDETNA